jgi:hypothetical protein
VAFIWLKVRQVRSGNKAFNQMFRDLRWSDLKTRRSAQIDEMVLAVIFFGLVIFAVYHQMTK